MNSDQRTLATGTLDSFKRTGDGCYLDNADADTLREMVRLLVGEGQAVLDCINLYGDETLHDALDAIGWPNGATPQSSCPECGEPAFRDGAGRACCPRTRRPIPAALDDNDAGRSEDRPAEQPLVTHDDASASRETQQEER